MRASGEDGSLRWLKESATLFALAGCSNMCASAITNPVNVVKVRMQIDGALSSTQERIYPGLVRGMLRIAKEEGIGGLWRGTGAALMREASYSSIRMGLYEPFKKMFGANDPSRTPLWIKITAGSLAGVIGSAVANPTDVVMVRMQASGCRDTGASHQYRGSFHAFHTIARSEGIQGLYRGVWPTMQRAGILNAVQAPAYDHTKHTLLNAGLVQEGISSHLISSMVAGLATAVAISPVDLIRTRIMQQAVTSSGSGVLYSSTLDCFWKTLRVEGPQGLYKGFVPVWMRIGPHTIITFFVFEELRRLLGLKPL